MAPHDGVGTPDRHRPSVFHAGSERPAPCRDVIEPAARRPYPSKLFVEVTTRCNLKCPMCVLQSTGSGIIQDKMSDDTFDRLAPVFPHLESLVLNGIGEPLMHRGLERFIATARRRMPSESWIGFQTNGQLLREERAASLMEAGVDRVVLSADAVTDDQLVSIRDGARIDLIEKSAQWLFEAARSVGRQVRVGLEFVVMRENLEQLPDLVRWAGPRGFAFIIVTHLLPYDASMTGRAAFSPTTDRALGIYRKWREIARTDGVDLERYVGSFMHFMHFDRPEHEARINHYVQQMVEDAAAQGVSLRIKDLLLFDDAWLRRVEETFARAAAYAVDGGVDLSLPVTSPTHVRRCDFIEEGSAFVSWNGDLHPCYFLWHDLECHLGGLARSVRPVCFGNVRDKPLLDVWNDRPWREFRNEVTQYEFPFCYDCNLAMCDYVRDGEFEQDCHIGAVPCAACLWCSGPFQCLR